MGLGLGPLELLNWLQQRSRANWGSPLKAACLELVFALWGFVCGREGRGSLSVAPVLILGGEVNRYRWCGGLGGGDWRLRPMDM
jgi:hypothetical protein